MTLVRVPEPDTVMEADASVDGFHTAGLPGGPLFPIYHFNCRHLARLLPRDAHVLDLACGPAHFVSHLLAGREDLNATGVDLSRPMLDKAERYLHDMGLLQRVELVLADAANAVDVVKKPVDVVVCMSALHQCPTTSELSSILDAVSEMRARDGCAVWLFDLVRPDSEKMIDVIPRSYELTSGEQFSEAFKSDWKNSLRAGWTFEELSASIRAAGLDLVSLEANHSQLHFAHRASGAAAEAAPAWCGPALSATDVRRIKTIEAAFDAAS